MVSENCRGEKNSKEKNEEQGTAKKGQEPAHMVIWCLRAEIGLFTGEKK